VIPLQNSKTPTCRNASRGLFWNYIVISEFWYKEVTLQPSCKSFVVPLQHGYGYTEFLHITSERGLRDGSLPAIGILHRRSVARIRAAEVLCQLSFAE
jgi:hypothetical protein